jgi:hypothetical protein
MRPPFAVVALAALAPVTIASAMVVPAGGYASSGGATAYVLDAVELYGLPPTELATAREWERADSHDRVIARADVAALRAGMIRRLSSDLPLAPRGALHLRVAVTVESPGTFLGLAPETADLAATADVLDERGLLMRSVTVRESANAPLQRSRSRRARLDAALSRLSQKLARQL